jgi:hypothetical protein
MGGGASKQQGLRCAQDDRLEAGVRQKQIPFGNDRKNGKSKSKSKSKSKNKGQYGGSSLRSGMTIPFHYIFMKHAPGDRIGARDNCQPKT